MWTLERQIRQLRCTDATRKKSNIAGKYSMLVEQGLTENVLSTAGCSCINLYLPRNGSNTKTQQYKRNYKQNESNDQVYHKFV